MSELTVKEIKAPPALAGRVRAGQRSDRGKLDALYRHYWLDLCKYINRKFGPGPPEPEDIAQAAFMKFATLKDPQAIQNPHAFLLHAARNIAIQELRRQQRRQRLRQTHYGDEEAKSADEITPERVILGKEEVKLIDVAIDHMPLLQRQLLKMSKLQGLSFAEISRRTGVPQTTVKRLVAQALAECADALKGGQ